MNLTAVVRPVLIPKGHGDGCSVVIRDISSAGVSFFSHDTWPAGQEVSMLIGFRKELAGLAAYDIPVRGEIVRRGFEEESGRPFYGMAITFRGNAVLRGDRADS